MANVIRIVGWSGSGKTTLIAGVVRHLAARGLSVAVIKHAHHDVELDVAGKDSFEFTTAGARIALVGAREKVAAFEAVPEDEPLGSLAARVPPGVDVVLAEGFHDAATPYFEMLGPSGSHDARPTQGELLGYIPAFSSTPAPADASAGVAATIARWVADRAAEHQLERLLDEARAFHGHVCPGQVLGVRLAVLGAGAVGIPERRSKSLVVWVEIDRCAADAIQTVTGCRPGKRTLKLVDHGKLAATFLNLDTGVAARVVARADSRERAAELYPDLPRKDAQLRAYRELPIGELFDVYGVAVELDDFDRPGKPLVRVTCADCAEEVNDGRHVMRDGVPLCRSCADGAYYRPLRRAPAEVAS
jgi:formylmethanofuran dehydrogenase subunit E